jgi:hypothetical protein
MHKTVIFSLLYLALNFFSTARAEGLDFGFGLGFADAANADGFDGGWDVQVGYEMKQMDHWNFGAQVHVIKGWTDGSDVDEDKEYGDTESTTMAFDSQAVYLTARPEKWWVQFRAGLVHARYYTVTQDENGIGVAAGAGLVIGSETIRLHLLDYNRYQIGADGFNIYSITIGVFF